MQQQQRRQRPERLASAAAVLGTQSVCCCHSLLRPPSLTRCHSSNSLLTTTTTTLSRFTLPRLLTRSFSSPPRLHSSPATVSSRRSPRRAAPQLPPRSPLPGRPRSKIFALPAHDPSERFIIDYEPCTNRLERIARHSAACAPVDCFLARLCRASFVSPLPPLHAHKHAPTPRRGLEVDCWRPGRFDRGLSVMRRRPGHDFVT